MSKARVKITVKAGKPKQGGALLARIPYVVERNDNPSGKRLYQTKAQASVRIKTTRGGQPRIRSRN